MHEERYLLQSILDERFSMLVISTDIGYTIQEATGIVGIVSLAQPVIRRMSIRS